MMGKTFRHLSCTGWQPSLSSVKGAPQGKVPAMVNELSFFLLRDIGTAHLQDTGMN